MNHYEENTHRVSHACLPFHWHPAVTLLATSEHQQQQEQRKTTPPREEEGKEEKGLKMLKKKAKRKKRGHTAIGKDGEEEAKAEEEDEIHKIDAATIVANMKKVPLIDKDTRGGGDPNFHGLKEHEEGHQQQKQHLPHSSRFRGVTKHKRSGRWEAHIWIRDTKKQVYLGGYSNEQHAAEAFDLVALKCKLVKNGRKIKLNYPASKYQDLQGYLLSTSRRTHHGPSTPIARLC